MMSLAIETNTDISSSNLCLAILKYEIRKYFAVEFFVKYIVTMQREKRLINFMTSPNTLQEMDRNSF